MVTYIFNNPDDTMAWFFKYVRSAREGGPYLEREYRLALICLVGVYSQKDQIDPEQLRRFRNESAVALASFENRISAFPDVTTFLAEGAQDGEWYELCMRRSAIQLLIDEYAGTPVAALIDPADVAALDVELRRVGKEYGPVPDPFVPKGLPDSHWWWFFPANEEGEKPE
jgi:hypothetical protein